MPTPPDPSDLVLRQEAAHLAHARAQLRAMRERTLALDARGGNAVSTEYLAAALHHRAHALVDDPDVPLFFGRIDIAGAPPNGDATEPRVERWYVGRRHVHDDAGDPVVVDWRADVSRAFYRASRADPNGVTLRRRFGFDGGRLTAYEDEHLGAPDRDPSQQQRRSAILAAEIERPRTGPMRDIVATIQPEQDEVVRADVTETVCVQGAPGTGKTAVGLHRAAYLLYAHRDRLARAGVLVVGPNRAFLGYIGAVLPALGELDVRQTTVDELVGGMGDRAEVRGEDRPEVATLKGDARLADVLRRAVWSGLGDPALLGGDALVVPRGSRRWRVPAYDVAEAVAQLRGRGVRYAAGRALLGQRLAAQVLAAMERAGESPDDLVLIDEAADLVERQPSLGHVVLDEAQDLSAMQLRAVGRRCATGSATVLGDIAQGTTPWAAAS